MLEEKGPGVRIWGKWMGSCLFADIVLQASLERELQEMLDVAAKFAHRWLLMLNPKKCGISVTRQRKQDRRRYLRRVESRR